MTNLALVVPGPRAGELPALGERGRRAGRRRHRRRVRGEAGDDLARGPRGERDRPGAPAGAEGRRRRHDLHARLDRRRPAQHRRLARRAGAFLGHGGRGAAGRDRGDRDEPARARRDQGRPALEPRARAALEPDRERVARRPRPRPRGLDRRDPDAADPQARRLRDRPVLPARRPDEARVHAQRARRVAHLRRLGRGRAARPADAPLHGRREAALRRRSTSRTSPRRSASSS